MNMKLWLKIGLIFLVIDAILSVLCFLALKTGFYFIAFPLIIINPSMAATIIRLDFLPYIPGGLYLWPIIWFLIGAIIGLIISKIKSK